MGIASKVYADGFNDAANGLLECLKHPPRHSCVYCKVMLNLSLRAIMRVHATSDDLCKVEDKVNIIQGSADYCRGWDDAVKGVRHSFSCHPENCSCLHCEIKNDIVRNVALVNLHRS